MFSIAAKNQALVGATGFSWASLHSAWPDVTGVNEIGVMRAALTWGAPANGRRQTTTGFGITVPGSVTVAWVGFWSAETGGVFQGAAPLGSLVYDIHTVLGANRIVVQAHPFQDNQAIVFYGGTPPAPLVPGTAYYVRDAITDQFRVASSPGGSAIALSAPEAMGAVVSSIAPIVVSGDPAVVNVPRVSLRWDPNYPPVWDASVSQITIPQGGTFNLNTICPDRNGDPLVFALAPDSAPLPAGVTLDPSSGLLSASSGATVVLQAGTFFIADDLQ